MSQPPVGMGTALNNQAALQDNMLARLVGRLGADLAETNLRFQ
jgi:hypothetical protein